MRKLLLVMSYLLLSSNVMSGEWISFSVSSFDNQTVGNGHPKSPIEPPTVYIENDTLMFEADHPEYVLNIKDEEDEVVYTTSVYSSVTQVILPSSLSGNYEIELIMGNWKFTGYITL